MTILDGVYWPIYMVSIMVPSPWTWIAVPIAAAAFLYIFLFLRAGLKDYSMRVPDTLYLDFNPQTIEQHYGGSSSKYLAAALEMESPWHTMRWRRLFDENLRPISEMRKELNRRQMLTLQAKEIRRKEVLCETLHKRGLDRRLLTDEGLLDEKVRKSVTKIVEHSWGTRKAERRWVVANWTALACIVLSIYLFGLVLYMIGVLASVLF